MVTNDIKIRFRNESNNCQPQDVLFFQKGVTVDFEEIAFAWKVIKNCPAGGFNDFVYTVATTINTVDPDGNHTAQIPAIFGNRYELAFDPCAGNQLSLVSSVDDADISVINGLDQGVLTTNLYKDGLLLASKKAYIPGDTADFLLHPMLVVGTATNIAQGAQLSDAVLKASNTTFDLTGIKSMDVVMTGGGEGSTAIPRSFHTENIVRAGS